MSDAAKKDDPNVVQMPSEAEKKLSQILANTPLGILTVKADYTLSDAYSRFAEQFLDKNQLAGCDLDEVLFSRCTDNMDGKQKDGAAQIKDSIGVDEFWFDSARIFFPKELKLPVSNNGERDFRWLGIAYHPVVRDNTVEEIVLVLEDRTEVVETRIQQGHHNDQDNRFVQKIAEIQKCDSELLVSTVKELNENILRLELHLGNLDDMMTFYKTLHGIKSIARTAGFDSLKADVHEVEDAFKEKHQNGDSPGHGWVSVLVNPILAEIREYVDLYQVVSSRVLPKVSDNSDAQTKLADLTDYESTIRARVEQTAKTLGKNIELHFDWQGVQVEQSDLSAIGEIALHILNNSLDHGLDDPEVRQELGKKPKGQVNISAKNVGEQTIEFCFQDDGQGIDENAVGQSALKKGIITEDELGKMDAQEKLSLIFRTGFSTRSETNEVSGRGVGFDAAVDTIKKLGGDTPTIQTKRGRGTSFTFTIYPKPQEEESDSTMSKESTTDELFLKAFGELCTYAQKNASESVERILKLSSKFVSSSTYENLLTFRDMYANETKSLDADRESINNSVDDIFEQAQALNKQGEMSVDEMAAEIKEDEKAELVRLGISGMQKKLEVIISTEDLLKNKLAPVITSMEFESAARSRVQHISTGLQILANDSNDLEEQINKLSNSMIDGEEQETFTKIFDNKLPKGA